MAAAPLTIIHFGDLHLWRLGLGGDPFPKRLLGLANLLLKRGRKFPATIAESLRGRLAAETADFVLFSGDLTTTALPAEFAAGARWLAPLRERWGERLIAIPGNHDRYTPRATREKWFERHLPGAPAAYPFSVDLNEAWSLAAFDCCVPRLISSRGKLPPGQFAALDAMLAALARRGRKILVMGHYPLRYPAGRQPSPEHLLEGREALLELLRRHGARLYLHGHKHQRWRLRDAPAPGAAAGLTHLNCGSAGMLGGEAARRPGYLKITLGGDGEIGAAACAWAAAGQWQAQPLAEEP